VRGTTGCRKRSGVRGRGGDRGSDGERNSGGRARRAGPKAGRGGSRRGRADGTGRKPCKQRGAARTHGRASRGPVKWYGARLSSTPGGRDRRLGRVAEAIARPYAWRGERALGKK
jgi:hypothetical protein